MAAYRFIMVGILFVISSVLLTLASDHSPLQDLCVADSTTSVFLNGMACKDPKLVKADDFYYSGLHLAGNTSNALGFRSTLISVTQVPGLNTLGISMVRLDFAPKGVNPPHTHPRASEILIVLEGCLEVGFVTSSPENRLITKTLEMGDAFVFPVGLIHFQKNIRDSDAYAIAALSSQNPGVISVANSVFGSNLPIPVDILAKAFQIDRNTTVMMQSRLLLKN